ncbi:hypothetical protein BDV96DRAFT_642588 [Lophiotrema nucula]|uniref:F-box domain-containing protein n=1 Tax=Lophiotrema nucula TaxID=690887 RepID=A0A6A5ZIY3_9PLEO|nr:hypothetical protein BDV96DRAFT_642588 [Lophiotrema nucula]
MLRLSNIIKCLRRVRDTVDPPDLASTILHAPSIQDSLLSQLEIRDIFSLCLSERRLSGLYDILLRTQFNINSKLRPFFTKRPEQFRSIQARANILITGHFVQSFFHRTPIDFKRSLQLRVEKGGGADELEQFLLEDGYELTQVDNEDAITPEDRYHLNKMKLFGKKSGLKVKVFILHHTPLYNAVGRSLLTSTMAFITHDKAYAVFPHLTFFEHRTYVLSYLVQADQNERTATITHSTDRTGQLELHERKYLSLTIIGLEGLDNDDRPECDQQVLDRPRDDAIMGLLKSWKPPNYWPYYDEEVIKFLRSRRG